METKVLVRNGDIAFIFAGAFIVGIAACTFNWNIPLLFLALFWGGAVAVYCIKDKRLWLALATTLLIFVFAVGYYHLFVRVRSGSQTTVVPMKKNNAFSFLLPTFNAVLPNRQAELLGAIINGSTASLDPDLKAQMSDSGTSYIVGMYGYKIGLFASVALGVGRRFFSRRIAFVVATLFIFAFVVVAGAPLSAVRAGIMTALVFLAKESGRAFHLRNIFTLVLLIILVFDPSSLGEASFQLSFLSLLGIFMLGPPCKRLFRYAGHELFDWKAHAIMALAVNAAIVPLVMVQFNDFPITSFVSNFLIAIPLAMIIGLALAIVVLSLVSVHLAFIVAIMANVFLSYQLYVIKIFSIAIIPMPSWFESGYCIALYYFLLIAFVIHYGKNKDKDEIME